MTKTEKREFYVKSGRCVSDIKCVLFAGCTKKQAVYKKNRTASGITTDCAVNSEILYKNAALPEALRSSAGKVKVPFDSFLRQTAGRADAFDGVRFSDLFETEIKEQLKGTALTKEDKEEFARFGESLGYLDVEMQKNAMKLYLKELEQKIEYLQKEIPQKRKLYQSLGVMGGIFLLILLWQ